MVSSLKIHVMTAFIAAVHGHETLSVDGGAEMMEFEKNAKIWAESVLESDQRGPSMSSMLSSLSSQMPLDYATRQVEKQNLPGDVALMVRNVHNTKSQQPFDASSLAKARNVLNDLAEGSWRDLDNHIVDCQEFKERNRNTHQQVVTDINRLVEQITDLERLETEAVNGIQQKEAEIQDLEAELKKEQRQYESIFQENSAEMTIRQNDLDVFAFILRFTMCENFNAAVASLSFLQQEQHENLCVCPSHDGQHVLLFKDRTVQDKYEKLMQKSSANTRKVISDVLAGVSHRGALSLVQSAPAPPLPTTTIAPPGTTDAVMGEEGFGDMDKACNCKKTGGCDRLHDEMSLLWGEYKDSVDELQMEMNRNEYNWFELKWSLNSQIQIVVQSKARFMQQLAETRSNMAADRSEKKEKEFQRLELDQAYTKEMHTCSVDIAYDCEKICQYKIVRNAVMETADESDPDSCHTNLISDCDVDNWVPEECSVPCDDSCDHRDDGGAGAMGCGGWQMIERKIVVKNNTCGMACPALSRWKRCNQVKCPVDCVLSDWSGFSSCTAECEGGVRGRTRSLMVKPKNGGLACNSVEEEESCNTMSCDRDCSLSAWTGWAPCSMACGGGWQERVKHVLIPIRGAGKCPAETNSERYGKQQCNTHGCVGDEICVAKQDLIIAVDGSGSITESGYNTLKSFTHTLVGKYQSRYREEARMRIGLISFGNGELLDDGTVSPAITVSSLTDNLGEENGGVQL